MEFEWDENKNKRNIVNRSLSFEQAKEVFLDKYQYSFPDLRKDYGEQRIIAFGSIRLRSINKNVVIVVVYTIRGQRIRIISARKANQEEREIYEEQKQRNLSS